MAEAQIINLKSIIFFVKVSREIIITIFADYYYLHYLRTMVNNKIQIIFEKVIHTTRYKL